MGVAEAARGGVGGVNGGSNMQSLTAAEPQSLFDYIIWKFGNQMKDDCI